MGDRLTQGFAYGFTNKNQVKMDMVIRNAAIFYNNEKDQVDNLVGQKDPEYSDSFIFRKTVLENIFLKLLPDSLGMLPNTAEGMEQRQQKIQQRKRKMDVEEMHRIWSNAAVQTLRTITETEGLMKFKHAEK